MPVFSPNISGHLAEPAPPELQSFHRRGVIQRNRRARVREIGTRARVSRDRSAADVAIRAHNAKSHARQARQCVGSGLVRAFRGIALPRTRRFARTKANLTHSWTTRALGRGSCGRFAKPRIALLAKVAGAVRDDMRPWSFCLLHAIADAYATIQPINIETALRDEEQTWKFVWPKRAQPR